MWIIMKVVHVHTKIMVVISSDLQICYLQRPEPTIYINKLPSSAKPQLQLQLCWLAELALILVNPATHPPHPCAIRF